MRLAHEQGAFTIPYTIIRLALTYAVVEILYDDALRYVVYILIFSTITDADSILGFLKGSKQTAQGRPASQSRSRFRELYGLILFSLALSICSFFVDIVLIQVIAISMILHYTADFLLCRTRPLYPYSDKEVYLRANRSSGDRSEQSEHCEKTGLVRSVRAVTDYVPLRLPLPKVNPNLLSGLSIITSLFFVLTVGYSSVVALSFLTMTLLLDWFDGLIAKKHNLCSEEGHIVDLTADRLSEGIIFIHFFVPWFYLFLLNTILTVFSFVKKKHTVVILRHAFLIVFFLSEFS